jgi:hypothetical protein
MSTLQSARFFIRLTTAAVLLASVGLPALARAQSKPSLATVAREESERRKTSKEAKKVITAKDLPESAQRPAAPSPSPAASGGAAQATSDGAGAGAAASDHAGGPAQKGDAPAADDAKGEAYWHTRMAGARENLRRTQIIYDALQARLGGLTADYNQSDLFERNKYLDARQNTAEESDRIKREIDQLKKAISDTEEEARKAGVPPGWLR